MKLTPLLKHVAVASLALGLTVGCASTPSDGGPAAAAEQAIADAKAAAKSAGKVNGLWRDTGKLIKNAEKALKAEDYKTATKLANKARQQAEMGENQALIEAAKAILNRAGCEDAAAQDAIKAWDGKRAHDLANKAAASCKTAAMNYTVAKGDSLWGISGKASVYNNPYQWPLIYKKNAGQIKDADLIYPRQVLSIDKNPSSGDVAAAVRHAKTRGAWTVGAVEASDRAYLGN